MRFSKQLQHNVSISSSASKHKKTTISPKPKVFESTYLHFVNDEIHFNTHTSISTLIFAPSSFRMLDLVGQGSPLGLNPINPLLDRFAADFTISRMQAFQTQSVKSFFISQQIDTPLLLQLKNSKYKVKHVKPAQRLINLLTSSGQHRRISLYFISVYSQLLNTTLSKNNDSVNIELQRSLLRFLLAHPSSLLHTTEGQSAYSATSLSVLPGDQAGFLSFNNRYGYLNDQVHMPQEDIPLNTLFDLLKRYYPIFTMKTKKVDKLKFKHSRGKSGKYSLDWAYVPRYNRLKVVMRWLINDVKFQKSTSFSQRLMTSLKALFLTPADHLVFKNRNYVHKVVYTKYKSTLLRTLTIKRS